MSMIPQGGPIHRFILQTFATTGQAPTLEAIQAQFDLASIDEADARLRDLEERGCIHRTAGDRLVTHAYPFPMSPHRTASPWPMAHRCMLCAQSMP